MSAFFAKVFDKATEGVIRTSDTIQGLINPDHRHDSPEEKAQDEIRAEICASHRFNSFAGERSQNFVKWHVDGHDYMYALSEMLDSARECIFILDWWLTPELYLRRPPAYHPEWRLDRVLRRKAEQGVKVYVIVYKEVTQTMNMSSHHTKETLEALHPNIACMRHPDHIGSKDNVEFWSHHEKVVVVDNHRACIGGLDLCFGRWDTHTHPLADVHPTDFSKTLFPGQDYNNARVLDFQHVDRFVGNAVSILETARMPWHDVHMSLTGDVVLDIVQHFVERWNEIRKRKYSNDERYDVLALPHNVDASPNEAVVRHPHREAWHAIGRRFRQRFHLSDGDEDDNDHDVYPPHPTGSCRVQCVRSVSDWSHGVLTEHSIQNAYIQLIMEASHYIYIENQFFISNTVEKGPVKNLIAKALTDRILQAARDGQKFKVVVLIPEVPGFSGNIKDETPLKTIMAAQYRTINRGGDSIYEVIRKEGYDPEQYIKFYHLRSYDRINAPYGSFIGQMEQNSGVSFHEAQVALARQWIGQPFPGVKVQDKVYIKKPPTTGEALTEDKSKVEVEEIPLPATEDDARQIVERFERGADDIRGDEDVADTVSQHMLQDRTALFDEKWLGTETEERDAYVSELLYIHSKVMIVDDRRVIMGSANINDRSQKGDGDSEIALIVEDNEMIETTMDGRPYMAARFAATLRRQLYKEHLGLIPPQDCQSRHEQVTAAMRPAPIPNEDETDSREDELVADPLADETLDLFDSTAKKNRAIFTEIFRPVPTNLVRDWKAYENYLPKVKTGHLAPGVTLDRAKELLNGVRGALVDSPLDFLIDERELVENPDWLGLNPTLPIYI
ncbi:phospholipase D nuclease [Pyrrhoderma noxium]|uniref:Phospholipase n=1 Tax=Pyrrhoderma noxium TaxID=2282107 RepID=A0A286U5G7_9AGAM|nr:phospholipase D nuclease [Pyrrhoderma noxium]